MSTYQDAVSALSSLADSVESRLNDDRVRALAPSPGPYKAYDNAEEPLLYVEVTAGMVTDVWISDEVFALYSPEELSISLTMVTGYAYDMYYEDNGEGDLSA